MPFYFAAADALPSWTPLLNYGVLGIFAVFFLWFAKQVFDRLVKERDEERQYSRDLEKDLRDQVMPLLSLVNQSTTDAIKAITEMRAELLFRGQLRKAREDDERGR